MPEPVIEPTGVSKRFGELTVLRHVDFAVAPGEAVGVAGPNGARKTTLLSVLAGTRRPNAGTVRSRRADITRMRADRRCRKGISCAYPIPRLFGGMTVLENVLIGATHGAGLRRQAAYPRSIEVLERCALAELANRRAESLGLLHRKRMELARALATGPAVLLLDEIGGVTRIINLAHGDLAVLGAFVVWVVVDRWHCRRSSRSCPCCR